MSEFAKTVGREMQRCSISEDHDSLVHDECPWLDTATFGNEESYYDFYREDEGANFEHVNLGVLPPISKIDKQTAGPNAPKEEDVMQHHTQDAPLTPKDCSVLYERVEGHFQVSVWEDRWSTVVGLSCAGHLDQGWEDESNPTHALRCALKFIEGKDVRLLVLGVAELRSISESVIALLNERIYHCRTIVLVLRPDPNSIVELKGLLPQCRREHDTREAIKFLAQSQHQAAA